MNRPVITLDPDEMDACRRWAANMVGYYAADPDRCRLSHGGAERDASRQLTGRVAEVAVAKHCRLDPRKALPQSVHRGPDPGFDLILPGGTLLEVKGSAPGNRLVWPPQKNHLYRTKRFHVLVSVSVRGAVCTIDGWIAKGEFLRLKQIADGGVIGPGLWKDTWFMPKDHPALRAIDDLLWIDAHYRRAA